MPTRTLTLHALVLATTATLAACQGAAGTPGGRGAPGAASLIRTAAEPAGTNCPTGGTKVEVGVDANANGTLDPVEVDTLATRYVCNGPVGHDALVRTSPEPAGTRCPWGGVRIEVGLDANASGVLDPAEVNGAATTFVCNPAPGGGVAPSTGIHVAIDPDGVRTTEAGAIAVRFTVRDDRGFPVDLAGRYSVNAPIDPHFALARYGADGNGAVGPLDVYTRSGALAEPDDYSPAAGQGTLVENGANAGDYTYTFPTAPAAGAAAIAYDPARLGETHVVWIQASRQADEIFPTNANTFWAANASRTFVPDGSGTPRTRELVTRASCDGCHAGFRPETTTSSAFHGGARVDPGSCNVCHNAARTSSPAADSAVFVHRIHRGAKLQPANLFQGRAAPYPQDLRRCDACHGGAAQGGQAYTAVTRKACGSCHDAVSFDGAGASLCTDPPVLDAGGVPVPCRHFGGAQGDDGLCTTCHTPQAVVRKHLPVIPPDPNNGWAGGTNSNTNAAFVAAAGVVPPGAAVIAHDVAEVGVWDDLGTTRPFIRFKLKKDGADVVFQTYQAGVTTELMAGFVGSPSVYFAFAVPQDGSLAPASYNASARGYLKNIWNGTATGTGAGTLTGPDAGGYYTIKLGGVRVPAAATLLAGGVGYTYALSTTPPLTQIDLPAYPYNLDGRRQGGLVVPARNVWKTATGFSARRPIVETARCETCHARLGIAPTFHGSGQLNDASSCAFCHTPNRASAGWSGSAAYFIHAVHAGRVRTTPFTWHSTAPGVGFAATGFPARLNDCAACHAAGTHDFTAPASAAAVPAMTAVTVATGKYNADPLVNASWFTISPYVTADDVMDYGAGFSFNAATGAITEAAPPTLVISPITAACAGCHDSSVAVAHMKDGGGSFYGPRSDYLSPSGAKEACLMCHGPGRVAAIGAVHPR